jgi:hypothetical protein
MASLNAPPGDTGGMAFDPRGGDGRGPGPEARTLPTVDRRGAGAAAGPAEAPGDPATVGTRRGFGPFVTFIEYERPDGVVARWDSRRHRKHARPTDRAGAATWWAPRARGWWIAILFAIGSALFALGAVPGYVGAVGARTDSITFFVGSIFFTAAGFLQYRESVDAGGADPSHRGRKVLVYRPGQIDWWASGVQLIGTVFFNVSTGNAVRIDLSAQAAQHHVWRPDAVGSVCFLVASGLAWFEVSNGWASWSPTSLSWWITALNLFGSIAFGVSAVAAFIIPSTGKIWHVELSNLGTFVGALCFLAGAVLLLPERTSGTHEPDPAPIVGTGPR